MDETSTATIARMPASLAAFFITESSISKNSLNLGKPSYFRPDVDIVSIMELWLKMNSAIGGTIITSATAAAAP